MSNILDDVIDEVVDKIDKKKPGMKWYWKLTIFLVSSAFAIGGFRVAILNKINDTENQLESNTTSIKEIKHEIKDNYNTLNTRIDAVNNRIDNFYYNKQHQNNEK